MECEPEPSRIEPFVQVSPNTESLGTTTQESPSNQINNNNQPDTASQTRMETECIQITTAMTPGTGHQIPFSVVSPPMTLNNATISRQPGSSRSLTVNTNGLLGHSRLGTTVPASLPPVSSQLSVSQQYSGIGSMLLASPRNILAGIVLACWTVFTGHDKYLNQSSLLSH